MPVYQQNPAKSTSYLFTIGDDRDLSFKVRDPSIGSVNLGSTMFPTRYLDLELPNNKLEFGPMSLRVLLSETLGEWFNLVKWMVDITETNGAHLESTVDAELDILNAQNIPVLRIIYKSVYPLNLGDIIYGYDGEEVTQTCELSVKYDYYVIENLLTGEKIEYGQRAD